MCDECDYNDYQMGLLRMTMHPVARPVEDLYLEFRNAIDPWHEGDTVTINFTDTGASVNIELPHCPKADWPQEFVNMVKVIIKLNI